jgi:hypothetical protein
MQRCSVSSPGCGVEALAVQVTCEPLMSTMSPTTMDGPADTLVAMKGSAAPAPPPLATGLPAADDNDAADAAPLGTARLTAPAPVGPLRACPVRAEVASSVVRWG